MLWGHITVLLDKLDDQPERDWCAAKAVESGWTRKMLLSQIIGRLHLRADTEPANFTLRLHGHGHIRALGLPGRADGRCTDWADDRSASAHRPGKVCTLVAHHRCGEGSTIHNQRMGLLRG